MVARSPKGKVSLVRDGSLATLTLGIIVQEDDIRFLDANDQSEDLHEDK